MTAPHVNPTGRTAVAKLANSQLTDQLEGLGDVDLSQLNLIAGTQTVPIRDLLADATITRTTLGASSLVLTVNDSERRLLTSGIFGDTLTLVGDANKTILGQQIELFNPVDTEIDGLYFRLTAVDKAGDTLTLTFQDREVALLRSYPKKGDPHTYMTFTPPQTWTRIRVMRYLIQQVTETAEPIRIVSPMLGQQDPIVSSRDRPGKAVKGVNHAPGFPANGKSGVTVKGASASASQLTILEHILDVGVSMGASRKLLVVSVMVATQESDVSTSARNGDHLGVFQQDSSPKSSWTQLGGGTGTDVSADAHAFFTVAKQANVGDPGADYYQLAEDIQHSGQGQLYGQWRDEAENTVSVYLGSDQANPNVGVATTLSSGFFYRGSEKVVGSTVVQVREDNWAMLQRLASEVGWACYCVSGTVYIEPDKAATTGAVRFQFNEDTDTVNQIDFSVNTSRAQAKATVTAHAKRWAAPPGSICQLTDMGPADGRWFVQTIARSLFNDLATITLAKPQPTLLDAESATPIQATQLAVSGTGTTGTATTINLSAAALAKRLLSLRGHGWSDDNGRGAAQLQKVANRQQLTTPLGQVTLDARTIRVILWLIENHGYTIGTFAWAEDHPTPDGTNGHQAGKAVDISSVNGVGINTEQSGALTMAVARALHGTPADLQPRQLICGGYGGHRDAIISALSIPGADAFYGAATMQQHTNHIHVGY